MKKAFTIIELAVVIAILGILLGIVSTAAGRYIRQARIRKEEALCKGVPEGLATYYAQKDKWPDPIGDANNLGTRSNQEGVDNHADYNKYILTGPEVRSVVKALVDEAKKGNPLMDISGLYVSRNTGEPGQKGYGLDFMEAIHGTRKSSRKMSTSEMYFGYPEADHGWFRRFKIVYSLPTDEIKVTQQ